MPINLASFLAYTFMLYIGCVICNEFGLLLVVGITSTMLFYIRSRNFRTKLLYTAVCGMGALLSCIMIGHIQERVYIWMHLSEITPEDPLAGKAESVLYVSETFHGPGSGERTWKHTSVNLSDTEYGSCLCCVDAGVFTCVRCYNSFA